MHSPCLWETEKRFLELNLFECISIDSWSNKEKVFWRKKYLCKIDSKYRNVKYVIRRYYFCNSRCTNHHHVRCLCWEMPHYAFSGHKVGRSRQGRRSTTHNRSYTHGTNTDRQRSSDNIIQRAWGTAYGHAVGLGHAQKTSVLHRLEEECLENWNYGHWNIISSGRCVFSIINKIYS